MPLTTLVHLSDLHFDRVSSRVVRALHDSVHTVNPNCVVLSGDLTQRAFRKQFRIGCEFLNSLPGDKLAIAGNHDVPIHRPLLRFTAPLARFHQLVEPDPMPVWDDGHVCIVGINTARSFSTRWKGFWKDGAIARRQIVDAVQCFKRSLAPYRVLVTHHPMFVEADTHRHDLVRGYTGALEAFATFGVDLFLYGHLHLPHVIATTVRAGDGPPHRVVGAMAGTGCSTRTRGGIGNSYNVCHFDERGFTVTTMRFDGNAFVASPDQFAFPSERRRTNPARR
jgi:3',5'-cyclic AMP phosphodiesterase CpdA